MMPCVPYDWVAVNSTQKIRGPAFTVRASDQFESQQKKYGLSEQLSFRSSDWRPILRFSRAVHPWIPSCDWEHYTDNDEWGEFGGSGYATDVEH